MPRLDTIKHTPSLLGDGNWPREMEELVQNETFKIPAAPLAQDIADANSLLCYQMKSIPRGVGLIINNKNFPPPSLGNRRGTDKDAAVLKLLFTYLGFKTKCYNNQTKSQMVEICTKVASLDHTKFDCLLIAILTHGTNGQLYGSDGKLISVQDIVKLFNGAQCPSLVGKPKIFFLQACRGKNTCNGITYVMRDGDIGEEDVDEMDSDYKGLLTNIFE